MPKLAEAASFGAPLLGGWFGRKGRRRLLAQPDPPGGGYPALMVEALLTWGSIAGAVLMVLARLWSGPPARTGTEARSRLDEELTSINAEIKRLQRRK